MTQIIYVWYGQVPDRPRGPGAIYSVVNATDEEQARELTYDMIGRHGRSLLSDQVARMEWEKLGVAYSLEPEIVTGHWSK